MSTSLRRLPLKKSGPTPIMKSTMAVFPTNNKTEGLEWAESHEGLWLLNFAAIGLTNAQATAFKTASDAMRTKFDAAIAARQAAKAKTVELESAWQALKDEASEAISLIKAYAKTQADPLAVYAAAQIPPPAQPQPAGPPDTPVAVTGFVDTDGTVVTSWNGTLAYRTFFSVWRKLPGETGFTQIGVAGEKTFTDFAVPQGSAWAQYQIKAHRGKYSSAGSEPLTVLFGVEMQQAA